MPPKFPKFPILPIFPINPHSRRLEPRRGSTLSPPCNKKHFFRQNGMLYVPKSLYLCTDMCARDKGMSIKERVRNHKSLIKMLLEILRILLGGFCVGLASSVTVGPVAVLCIQRTLSKGHLSGIVSGLGVACADTLLAILAFSAYALLKSYIDEYNTIIQLIGGGIVILIGIYIFFQNPVPQIRKNRAGQSHLWQDFGSMFGITLTNFVFIIPYILAFFTMFNIDISISVDDLSSITKIVEYESWGTIIQNLAVILGFLLGAMVWWISITSVINLFRRKFRPRHMLTLNHVAGIVIGSLGMITIISVII